MTPAEYLDACKAKIGVESDYELLKRINDDPRHSTGYRNGSRAIPLATTFAIAITLELDPATVVADLEAQREKNPKRRDFWAGFIRRAAVVAALVCTLGLSFSGISEGEAAALGGAMAASAAYFLARQLRIICIMLNNVEIDAYEIASFVIE